MCAENQFLGSKKRTVFFSGELLKDVKHLKKKLVFPSFSSCSRRLSTSEKKRKQLDDDADDVDNDDDDRCWPTWA